MLAVAQMDGGWAARGGIGAGGGAGAAAATGAVTALCGVGIGTAPGGGARPGSAPGAVAALGGARPDGASSWRPPKDVAHPFAFTPNARSCVHVHADTTDDGDQQHVLILSETADLKEIRRIKSPCKIVSLLISPDDSLRLWNIW